MKKDNNLIKITNMKTGESRYFTKNTYILNYIGCSQTALPAIIAGNSRDYSHIKYELIDGSNIKYKDINII